MKNVIRCRNHYIRLLRLKKPYFADPGDSSLLDPTSGDLRKLYSPFPVSSRPKLLEQKNLDDLVECFSKFSEIYDRPWKRVHEHP